MCAEFINSILYLRKMSQQLLQKSLDYLKGVGPSRAELLRKELQLHTYQDLLYFFPFRYIDRTAFHSIGQLPQTNAEVQIIGIISRIETVQQKRGKRLEATFEDQTGRTKLVWFRGHQWVKKNLKLNTPYVAFGRLNWYGKQCSIPHPELELTSDHEQQKNYFQAVYPSTERLTSSGIGNRILRQVMLNLFQELGHHITESLSESIIHKYQLISKSNALKNIHFPKNQLQLEKAQYRMKFEELFFIQLQLILKKQLHKQKIKGLPFEKVGNYFNEFYNTHLPFKLTHAQKRVIKEIRADVGSKAQMNRLLQGDVGSGKTIVAVLTILLAIDNGFQATLVAPTEILAQQHYQSIQALLKPLNIQIGLLTGSTKLKDRAGIHENLRSGTLNMLIGTHAIFEKNVIFKHLGLAIIDEQHRFGVAQRAKLWRKNELPPHILVMTATPIPRTLAMTVYGNLDLSIIDELPPGRKPITTTHRHDSNRLAVLQFIKEQIKIGRQVYIVYPLIEESEVLDYKDLMDGYASIERDFPKPKYQISIVHGQMKAEDKAKEMNRFAKGETHIMIATTVIEVGVNVPNASVMIIESAERFGLSQLHQLRGRVGRGADKSFCILMSGYKLSQDARTRLQTMVRTQDGFEIAEVDLKLRGPGDLMGTQQSGILKMIIADLKKDYPILQQARNEVIHLISSDPQLIKAEHRLILETYRQTQAGKTIWKYIS